MSDAEESRKIAEAHDTIVSLKQVLEGIPTKVMVKRQVIFLAEPREGADQGGRDVELEAKEEQSSVQQEKTRQP